ncbi:hypothetical protein SFRURICE_014343, partial [Spodoptera frugiperda]
KITNEDATIFCKPCSTLALSPVSWVRTQTQNDNLWTQRIYSVGESIPLHVARLSVAQPPRQPFLVSKSLRFPPASRIEDSPREVI